MNFFARLWDHLGSNLSSYVQAQELQPGVPKAEPSAGDQPGKTGSDKIESVADKGNYVETYGHHKNRENKGHVKGDNDEAPLPRKSVAKNVNIRDEDQPSDSQSKPRRFLQSTIHKKRRRNDEEQHQRKVTFSCFLNNFSMYLCTGNVLVSLYVRYFKGV